MLNLTIFIFAAVMLIMGLIWSVKVYDALKTSKRYEAKGDVNSIMGYHKDFLDPESKSLIKKEGSGKITN
tara:strand:+ start:510 stop:719 length:210 start_codon:yes stop_codon:yes gene_type:complete